MSGTTGPELPWNPCLGPQIESHPELAAAFGKLGPGARAELISTVSQELQAWFEGKVGEYTALADELSATVSPGQYELIGSEQTGAIGGSERRSTTGLPHRPATREQNEAAVTDTHTGLPSGIRRLPVTPASGSDRRETDHSTPPQPASSAPRDFLEQPRVAVVPGAGGTPVVPGAAGGDGWMRSWAASRNWTVEFADVQFGRAFALVADVFPYRPRPAGTGVDVGYRERLGSLVAAVAVARAGAQSTSKGKEGEHGPSASFDEQLASALRGVVVALDADAGPVSGTGARPESGDGQAVAGTGRTVGDALRELAALVPDTPGQELLELLQAVRAAQDDTDSESVPGEADAMIRTLALEDLPRTLAIWAHTAYSTLRPMPLSVDAAAVDALHQQRADHIRDIVTTAQHTAHTLATTPSRQDIHRETAHLIARTADQPRIPGQSGARTTLTPRDRHDLRTETVRHLRTLYGDTPPTTAIRTGPDIRTWDDLVTEDTTLQHWTTLSDTERHLPLTGQAWLLAPHYLTHPTPPRMHGGGGKKIDDNTLYAAFKQYFAKPGKRNTVPEYDETEPLQTGSTEGADTASGAAASPIIVPIGRIVAKMREKGRVLGNKLYTLLVANYWVMTIKEVNKEGENVWSLESRGDMQDKQYAAAYAAFYRANRGQQPRKLNDASRVWGLDLYTHLHSLKLGRRSKMNEALVSVLQENKVKVTRKIDSGRFVVEQESTALLTLVPVAEEPPEWWPEDLIARSEGAENSDYSFVSGRGRVPALGPAGSSRTGDPNSYITAPTAQTASLALGHEPALPQSHSNSSAFTNRPKNGNATNTPRALRAREISAWFEDTNNYGKIPRSIRTDDDPSESGRTLKNFLAFWPRLRREEQYADSLYDPILKALQAGGTPLNIKEKPTNSKPGGVTYRLNDEKEDRIRIDSDSVARILSVHGMRPAQARPGTKTQKKIGARLEELEAWFKEHPGKTPVLPPGKQGVRNAPEELREFYHWWASLSHNGITDTGVNRPFVEMFDREGVRLSRRVRGGIQKIFVDDTPQMRVPLGEGARAAISALHQARRDAGPGGEVADSPGAGEDLAADAMEADEGPVGAHGGETPPAYAAYAGGVGGVEVPEPAEPLAGPGFEDVPGPAQMGAGFGPAQLDPARVYLDGRAGLSAAGWTAEHLVRLRRQTDEVYRQDRERTYAALYQEAARSGAIDRRVDPARGLSREVVLSALGRQNEQQHRLWPVTDAEAPLLWTIATTSGGHRITAVQLAAELRNRRTTPTVADAPVADAPGGGWGGEGGFTQGEDGSTPVGGGLIDDMSVDDMIEDMDGDGPWPGVVPAAVADGPVGAEDPYAGVWPDPAAWEVPATGEVPAGMRNDAVLEAAIPELAAIGAARDEAARLERARAYLEDKPDLVAAGLTPDTLVRLRQQTDHLFEQEREQAYQQLLQEATRTGAIAQQMRQGHSADQIVQTLRRQAEQPLRLWPVTDTEADGLWSDAALTFRLGQEISVPDLANDLRNRRTAPPAPPAPPATPAPTVPQDNAAHPAPPEPETLTAHHLHAEVFQRAETFLSQREDLRTAQWTTPYLVKLWEQTNSYYLQALEQHFLGHLPDPYDPLNWQTIQEQGLWQIDENEAVLLWTIAATHADNGTQPTPHHLATTLRTHRTNPTPAPTPTNPPTTILRAHTQNHHTNTLNQQLLHQKLSQLPENDPTRNRITKILKTHPPTTTPTHPPLPPSFLDAPRPTPQPHPTRKPNPAPAPNPPTPPDPTPTEIATKNHPLPWQHTPALQQLLNPPDTIPANDTTPDPATLVELVRRHRTELTHHLAESITTRLDQTGTHNPTQDIYLDITTFPGNNTDMWLSHVLPQLPTLLNRSIFIPLAPDRDLHLCPPA
uniref:hypothetical protein n=1 Tax=Streptomyces anthocyanicus TaxID=68174 RepID=UPI002F9066F7|nr:hypothetical protein OHA15_40530 [Streptomyces anthocyanicus]